MQREDEIHSRRLKMPQLEHRVCIDAAHAQPACYTFQTRSQLRSQSTFSSGLAKPCLPSSLIVLRRGGRQ